MATWHHAQSPAELCRGEEAAQETEARMSLLELGGVAERRRLTASDGACLHPVRDTGWVDSPPRWAAAGDRWVTGQASLGGLRARPAWKQPAREGRSLLSSSARPAMGSLCRYPMGKHINEQSGQDAAGASAFKQLRGRRLAWRPTRREVCWLQSQQGLRAAGLGREKDTAGPRGKAVQGASECWSLGLPCMPQSSSQETVAGARTGRTNGRARRALRKKQRAGGPHGATWLILPVVICLSQRLSHACLSINCFIL